MTNIFKRAVLSLALLMGFAGIMIGAPAQTFAAYDPLDRACDKSGAQNSTACQVDNPSKNPIIDVVKRVTNIVAIAAGIIAVIMIIFYGFQFVKSAGDPQAAKSARMGIIYAAVGLIVIALATPLIHLIMNNIG
jgi:hypothetical protein